MANSGNACNRIRKLGWLVFKTGRKKYLLIRTVADHHINDLRSPQFPLNFKPICATFGFIRRPKKLVQV